MSYMSVRQFFDTNVLVYGCNSTDLDKQAAALRRISEASAAGTGVLSVQVLGGAGGSQASSRRNLRRLYLPGRDPPPVE